MSEFIITNNVLTEYKGKGKNVTIPDGVTEIAWSAFHGCIGLQSITIPDSVKEIGKDAFEGCDNIRECVLFPETEDESRCDWILDQFSKQVLALPFLLGKMKTNAIIHEKMKKYCTSKANRQRYLPTLIEKQETDAVIGLLSLVKKMQPEEIEQYLNLSVEKGTVEITNRLIEYQNKLYPIEKVFEMQNVEMEKAIGIREKTLADYRKEFGLNKDGDTIKSYKGKGSMAVIPGNIKGKPVKIAEKAFKNCANIQTVYIEDGVTNIGESAFEGCTSLQSITIPDSITSIADYAFYYCTSLQSITIPDSVTNISESAFRSCPNVTIHAPADSYAEQYAKRNNIKFQAI